jgi:predicted phage terminase large subunit-like protein
MTGEWPDFVRSPAYAIAPHPEAPAFSSHEAGQVLVKQLVSEMTSSTPQLQALDVIDLIRQLGLVSLFFFLKHIAGQYGPYSEIDSDLHLDMCNFRQSRWCMEPGARAAAFLFRGSFKSTIFTHGAAAWELTRNGDERFRFIGAKAELMHKSKWVTQRVFDSNPFYQLLYPKRVPAANAERWNQDEMVMPTRSKYWKEPSIQGAGIEGAAEGDHHTVLVWDDPIGLDSLDAAMASAAQMETAKKKFATDSTTLLVSKRRSRNLVVATFYAPDDLYVQHICRNCRQILGYPNEEIETRPDGEWTIYYRSVVENGKAICPETLTKIDYERMLQDDPWTAIRQYKNSFKAIEGAGGIAGFKPKRCLVKQASGGFVINRPGDFNFDEKASAIHLDDCSTALSIDPAGTEGNITSQTSRTAMVLWAMDSDENVYLIWKSIGYFADDRIYEATFEAHDQFPGLIQSTLIETNAMQIVLKRNLEREMLKRGRYFDLIDRPAKGDKRARIRHTLAWFLSRGKLYLAEGCAQEFIEELAAFPGSRTLDVLDASEKAIKFLQRPANETEKLEMEIEEDERMEKSLSSSGFGY